MSTYETLLPNDLILYNTAKNPQLEFIISVEFGGGYLNYEDYNSKGYVKFTYWNFNLRRVCHTVWYDKKPERSFKQVNR